MSDRYHSTYYVYGLRVPKWLFVLVYGEPRFNKLATSKLNGGNHEVRIERST